MKNKIILSIIITLILAVTFTLVICIKNWNKDNLKYSNKNDEIVVENNNLSISFNSKTGSIKKIKNKNSNLELELNEDSNPISIKTLFKSQNDDNPLYSRMKTMTPVENSFTSKVIENTKNSIQLEFGFTFINNVKATTHVILKENADEIVFNVALNNLNQETIEVTYPILNGIKELSKDGKDDYLLSSFATGYLVNNPVNSLINNNVTLSGASALYPSGFGQTMQFMAYYQNSVGGFYLQTKDGRSNSIKDFNVINNENSLEFSISHYVDDLNATSQDFSYDTILKNLVKGTWYECANIYRSWATNQVWCNQGKNINKLNLNKELYENTTLCNFVFPTKNTPEQEVGLDLYKKIKSFINEGKILTVGFYNTLSHHHVVDYNYEEQYIENVNDELIKLIEENKDLFTYFMYTDVVDDDLLDQEPDTVKNNQLISYTGYPEYITFGKPFDFICMGCSEWTDSLLERQKLQIEKLHASGDYVDIGISALHPLFCYNTNHSHGSRINILNEQYEYLKETAELVRNLKDFHQNYGFTGQEMITEQIIPYVDFYQARSASSNMGGMEHDIFLPLLKENLAKKIPLFEYIYHEYCGIRTDGFVLPLDNVGTGFYGSIAYTLLNGGIPQFNYEWINQDAYRYVNDNISISMMNYINMLSTFKIGIGKNYLTYGKMIEVPNMNIIRKSYPFEQLLNPDHSITNGQTVTGEVYYDQVVTSGFEYNNKFAVMLCNIEENSLKMNFDINTLELYGLTEGNVVLYNYDGEIIKNYQFTNGMVNIEFDALPRNAYLIEIC